MIQLFVIAQCKRGKTRNPPVEPLNKVNLSFHVSIPFTFGPGVVPFYMTDTEPAAVSLSVVSGWVTLTPGGPLSLQLQAVEVDNRFRAGETSKSHKLNLGFSGNPLLKYQSNSNIIIP
jgi:hypothetical protein